MRNVLTILLCISIFVAPANAGEKMRVHFIDVGQGDATLLEFPCAAILIDTGLETNTSYDGKEALKDYLGDFFSERPIRFFRGPRMATLVREAPISTPAKIGHVIAFTPFLLQAVR